MESNFSHQVIFNNLSANKIYEAKRLPNKTIIVRVQSESDCSEIYCLDENLSTKWQLKTIFEKDSCPNEIVWDSRLDENADSWKKAIVSDSNSFVVSSVKGITVTVNYENGEIVNSVFTK